MLTVNNRNDTQNQQLQTSTMTSRPSARLAPEDKRAMNEEIRIKFTQQRDQERLAFEMQRRENERRERRRQLENNRQLAGLDASNIRNVDDAELRRRKIRLALEAMKRTGANKNINTANQDRLRRIQNLPISRNSVREDEIQRQRMLQQMKLDQRKRLIAQIRSRLTMPKGSVVSDELLLKAYQGGYLQQVQRHALQGRFVDPTAVRAVSSASGNARRHANSTAPAPAAPETQVHQEKPPVETLTEEKKTAEDAVEAKTNEANIEEDLNSKFLTIQYDGVDYELLGVPKEMEGRKAQIEADKTETNLVYYFYEGDEKRSAVRLPVPKCRKVSKCDREAARRAKRKPALRLDCSPPLAAEPMDTSESPDKSLDSGLSSLAESGASLQVKFSAVEYLKSLHKTGLQ
ncbi:hypothetical protein L596_011529 [Steinernema carpocapsae]|uniref:Uncharacterized protein n=1 Tax=Steinernema carpocapsae TaxID=34508 RepID=A0A4U5NU69_STECR|nr:hypothetical protein L596_011529 [Steinernema carpocapsae]